MPAQLFFRALPALSVDARGGARCCLPTKALARSTVRPYNPTSRFDVGRKSEYPCFMPHTPDPPKPAGASKHSRAWMLLVCAPLVLSLTPPAPSARAQAGATGAASQQPRPQPRDEMLDEEDILRIDTDLVLVEVTVTGADGRPVRGLRAEDFKLYEDGEERPIAFVNVERRGGAQRPVALVFAVDVSGSMTTEEMIRLQSALGAFSEKVSERPATFALMSFGTSAKVHQSFTNSREKLSRSFERLMRESEGLST
ncbi:MAG: VWA domain-containing protein, partial [Acidobacteria bacterium]|nr:VWA domain-containing protein [Acidobacteriota bacterium]